MTKTKIYFWIILAQLILLVSVSVEVCAQKMPHPIQTNEGQWDGPFDFRIETSHSMLYALDCGMRIELSDPANKDQIHEYRHGKLKEITLNYHVFDMIFVDASDFSYSYTGQSDEIYNYFLGNDSTRWKSNLHRYSEAVAHNVWDNIDLVWKLDDQQIKYEWIVGPGANPENIAIRVEGAEKVMTRFDKLYIETTVGDYAESPVVAYQVIDGDTTSIASRWYVRGDVISYDVMEEYDHNYPLIIDPTLIFCTFSGSYSDNWGISATYDSLGNFYLGSITSGGNYPLTTGAFQNTYGGGTNTIIPGDVTVAKFNPTGTTMIYSTYLGGSGDESGNSLIVDGDELIVGGRTNSANFPTTTNAYDNTYNGGNDIFITKLNATGTALIGSTLLGGSGDDGVNMNTDYSNFGSNYILKINYGDDNRSEINFDDMGNIYIASSTSSLNFPFTYNSSSLKANQNNIIAKLNSNLSSLLWAGNYGGDNFDAGYVLDFSKNHDYVYMAGGTTSNNLPTNASSHQSSHAGGIDGYIMKIQTSNGALNATTYLGTNQYDQIYGLQVDDSNYVYVTGQTLGTWPMSAGVYGNAGSAQFIQKLDENLSQSKFSTVFGNGSHVKYNISPVAFLVDECGSIFVSGWGGNINAGASGFAWGGYTFGMPTSTNAIKTTTDGSDFYFIAFSKNAQSLLYATFFGQNNGSGEHVDGGTSRFSPVGQIYQGICANCSSGSILFPVTPGAYSVTNNSSNCNAAGVKIDFEYTAAIADAAANPDTSGCAPFVVNFQNNSLNSSSYFWDFDNAGATSTAQSPSYTYNTPGIYHPFLAVYNPNVCIERDTVWMTIEVKNDSLDADFSFSKIDSCAFTTLDFTPAITGTSGLDNTLFTYSWDFGNGNTSTLLNPGSQIYSTQGSYNITFTVTHPDACNSPVIVTKTFIYDDSTSVDANISLPDSLCLPANLVTINNSTYAVSYYWDFGDGTISTLHSPVHTYKNPGIYTITFVAINSLSCNITDTITKVIYCGIQPTADFTTNPSGLLFNSSLQTFNHSTNALTYLWDFGDGQTSTDFEPVHDYNSSGNYTICLTANYGGCTDTICKPLTVNIEPLIDVTTGFTPNGDNTNDFVSIRGFGVKNYDFKIYNRWGELVYEYEGFELGDKWDGYYKDQLQEADVFAYTLQVDFTDGTSGTKQGNITLVK